VIQIVLNKSAYLVLNYGTNRAIDTTDHGRISRASTMGLSHKLR